MTGGGKVGVGVVVVKEWGAGVFVGDLGQGFAYVFRFLVVVCSFLWVEGGGWGRESVLCFVLLYCSLCGIQ